MQVDGPEAKRAACPPEKVALRRNVERITFKRDVTT
jgi:hypothetical protein